MKTKKIILSLIIPVFLILCFNLVFASSVSVWQGQYYTGTTFNTGTYTFNFTVYDALTGGSTCFTNTTSLTTGTWGQWITEQSPWATCNNASKDYFLNINIAGTDQTPRRRLTVSDFLRRDASDIHEENITASYYFGDGQYLTGINGSGDITSVQGDNIYVYNGSNSGNVVLAFNETKLNSTIDLRASGLGDNSSWNESYANIKYLNLSGTNANQNINISPYNLTLGEKLTFRLGEFIDNIIDGWLRISGGLNVTNTAIFNEGINVSNDSYFFEDIYIAGKVRGLSPVEIAGGLNVTGNVTFNDNINFSGTIYGNGSKLTDIEASEVVDNSIVTQDIADGNITDAKISNLSWGKLTNIPAGLNDGDNDTTYSHLSNFTDDLVDRGYTSLSNFTDDILWTNEFNSTGDARWAGGVDTQKNTSGPYLYNDSNTIYFNETTLNNTIDLRDTDTTYFNSIGLNLNASNYFSILLGYQMPQGCNDGEIAEYNTTSGGWDCGIDNSAASGMASWTLASSDTAGSESITDGETVTFSDDNKYLNATRSTNTITYSINEAKLNNTIDLRDTDTTYSHLSNFTDDLGDRGYTSLSNFTNDLSFITEAHGNATYHRLSDFSISDYFTKTEVLNFNYYNSSDFNISDYYLKSNPFGFWNDTYATFNESYADAKYLQAETDPYWTGNYTNVAFTNAEETFTGNITTEGIKLEQDPVNHRIYDNATCVIIAGDTSTMYIC